MKKFIFPSLDNAVFDEVAFMQLLRVERKRTDRSGRPFLLLLLNLDTRFQERRQQRHTLVTNVIQALQDSTRQTDILGWHTNHAVLGAIFTELHHKDDAIATILAKIGTALKAHVRAEQINTLRVSVHVYPQPDDGVPGSSAKEKLYPDLTQAKWSRFLKRTIDISGSFGLLLLLSPVFVCIGVAIKLNSKGPILFRQTRVGRFGKPFTFLKFRSMYTNSDSASHQQYVTDFIRLSKQGDRSLETLKQNGFFKMDGDPRVTRVGHILRKTSLDELPQLLNVLVGTMSLVGPRPPIPYELESYDAWHLRRVLEAKPGITGLWQVKGRSRTTFDDMVRLDLKYIDKWSVRADLKILFQTPKAVLKGEGAG